jgi:hypothetical protein
MDYGIREKKLKDILQSTEEYSSALLTIQPVPVRIFFS